VFQGGSEGPPTWCQFHQHSTYSFCAHRSQKRKNTVKSSVSFYAFGIYNLYVERWWNWALLATEMPTALALGLAVQVDSDTRRPRRQEPGGSSPVRTTNFTPIFVPQTMVRCVKSRRSVAADRADRNKTSSDRPRPGRQPESPRPRPTMSIFSVFCRSNWLSPEEIEMTKKLCTLK
jgi:hypothetical protein